MRSRHHCAQSTFFACLVSLALLPCGGGQSSTPAGRDEPYVPGLGEIMTLQQMRHAKLWFAGRSANWALADYELRELGEGFDDVVRFHPTHEGSALAPREAIPRLIPPPLAELRRRSRPGTRRHSRGRTTV
jgi:hypothetical protein